MYCNICKNEVFQDFSNRKLIQCKSCKSLERHRLVYQVLKSLGYLDKEKVFGKSRLLHLAPEKMTYDYLYPVFGSGYYASDLFPEKYIHANVLKLNLPMDLEIFPCGYFDLIIHNHVLEHIPGSFKEHLDSFVSLLAPKGHMIFTIPGVDLHRNTIEGGEYLQSDAERLLQFGQEDHYKSFGNDLIEHLNNLPGALMKDNINSLLRKEICAVKDSIYIFKKH